jgi:hypothetical protein
MILTVIGLAIFEVIISLDNAVINAQVLGTMSKKSRRWFVTWGMIPSIFLVRFLLPLAIVVVAIPQLGIMGALESTLSSNPAVIEAIESASPILLIAGGTFLIFLFFHWLFLEPKNFGLAGEKIIARNGLWFFAIVSVILAVVTWFAINITPILGFGAVIGSTMFFIVHGFKENAEKKEKEMIGTKVERKMSDWSKIMYLEVIDGTFSVDGVIGAFAFTLAIPLILVGNGLGAIVVRQITISNIERIKRYKYIKNGAMYSVGALGLIMVLDSFGFHIPVWVSPLVMFATVGYFFWKSKKEM